MQPFINYLIKYNFISVSTTFLKRNILVVHIHILTCLIIVLLLLFEYYTLFNHFLCSPEVPNIHLRKFLPKTPLELCIIGLLNTPVS